MAEAAAKPVIFISYSHKDEPEKPAPDEVGWLTFVQSFLAPAVKGGVFDIWVDRHLHGGDAFDPEIRSKLSACDIFILLASRHSLASTYIVEAEIATVRQRQANGEDVRIFPIMLSPFPKAALKQLMDLTLKPGGGRALSSMSRNDREVAMSDIADDIAAAAEEIAERKAAWSPEFAAPLVRDAIPKVLEGLSPRQLIIDTEHLPETAYERLVGREAELQRLDKVWADRSTKILSLVAEGGAGKSALVNEWLRRLQTDGYRGAEAVLGWSFYSQGTKERATSAEEFLNWAVKKLGIELATTSASAKADAIAAALAKRRVLLVLDGVEPLQHGLGFEQTGLKDLGLRTLLRRFAAMPPNEMQGLVVLTSRLAVKDIARWEDDTAPVVDVGQLSDEAGAALLRDNGVWGIDKELKAASHDFGGHPLALGLLASYLKETQAGDVRQRDHIRTYFDDRDNPRHDHAKRVMESYENEWLAGQPVLLSIMHMIGLFEGPASGDCVKALRVEPAIRGLTEVTINLHDDEWHQAIARLREVRLLAPPDLAAPDALDAHPLIREWFGERLRTTSASAWKAAHGRLYEHLRDTTTEGELPTLEDLAPLYQAIAHGCLAGRHQEVLETVYIDRICRRKPSGSMEFYSTTRLGANARDLATISWFFDKPYGTPVRTLSEPFQNWLVSTASSLLRTRGRFSEALVAQRAGLRMNENAKRWINAATSACNLSHAELLVGEVKPAIISAANAVAHAGRSGSTFWMIAARTTHANALNTAGRRAQAEALFADAERLQHRWQPKYPLLYSMQGYDYCDLLLAKGNNAAVRDRASQTLEWVSSEKLLLDIALDTLTIGRAHLGLALAGVLLQQLEGARKEVSAASARLDRAVDGLRASDHSNYIPRGLLARGAFRRNVGDWEGATRDLDEVEEFAEPGPMWLYLCDMELERARIALARSEAFAPLNGLIDNSPPKPQQPGTVERKSLLSEAAKHIDRAADYIEKRGYNRRDEELAELRAVLRGVRSFADVPMVSRTGARGREIGSNEEEWLAQIMDYSETSVATQFGHQGQLLHFSRAIWSRIGLDQERSIHLSDIQEAAAEVSCSTEDALAVLALLSSQSVQLLKMEMKIGALDGARVNQAEFIKKLSDWWRDKKISEAEWRRWASEVEVRWVPTGLRRDAR